ncbi:hypothetical protein [Bacillus sp. SJS]|uniref:hypothetical protein n=1 Tax=Bacillus sp. SJS TaxID=1423321 RepID=UPI0004DD8512|nr:hypothetical protein [Bacillus sp. SJS]KZZ85126.1 hypothetical protein AS29_008750 [Bacillus sp. SJS]
MKFLKKLKKIMTEIKTVLFALLIVLLLMISMVLIDFYQGYSWSMVIKTFSYELKTSSMNDLFSLLIFALMIVIYLYITSIKNGKKKQKTAAKGGKNP